MTTRQEPRGLRPFNITALALLAVVAWFSPTPTTRTNQPLVGCAAFVVVWSSSSSLSLRHGRFPTSSLPSFAEAPRLSLRLGRRRSLHHYTMTNNDNLLNDRSDEFDKPRQTKYRNSTSNSNSNSQLSRATDGASGDNDYTAGVAAMNRRQWSIQFMSTAASLGVVPLAPTLAAASFEQPSPYLVPTPPLTRDLYWPTGKVAFSLLPLAGTSTRRKTVEQEIVPGQIWCHDQIQGIVNVNVPVRQTVVKLSNFSNHQGLWVHNPVAPTPELIHMVQRLEEQHGPVRHIVLGTVALEHKATFAAFASYFPKATVWIQPGQWAFPLNIPIELYGLKQRGPRLRELPVPGRPVTARQYQYYSVEPPEWLGTDFEYEVLGPFRFQSVGAFSETAFYHKPTKSLIVTDTVCSVTADPPAIVQEDPRALLYHARNSASDVIEDTMETRQRGWRRMVQFGLVFFPSKIQVQTLQQALYDATYNVPRNFQNLGEGAIPGGRLYPWTWDGGDSADEDNFEAISQGGKLFCPPILTKLILDREPEATLAWVDRVVQRFDQTERIIPSHLNNNIQQPGAGGGGGSSSSSRKLMPEFYAAFDPLRSRPDNLVPQRALAEDLALLQKASDLLTKYGIVGQSLVCDGEPARVRGKFRFASSLSSKGK
ncbi:hypothetical protein ACA910_012682 [Epithemia clementina (nom. ined.)]